MPKAKYDVIYQDLKARIESGEYTFQQLLPSEHTMVNTYTCSRNTVRRAISMLVRDGYVQTLHGKGVRNIYQPIEQTAFTLGGIETFKESVERNQRKARTKVLCFTELICDERIHQRTGFPVDATLFYIQKLRYLDKKPLIIDHNYFLAEIAEGLTKEIIENSIYEYLEHVRNVAIITSKRTMTVEKMTELDEKYIDLNGFNCMAVVSSQTYNDDGIMFEFTQSRHRPDYFQFQDIATRKSSL